MISDLRLAFRSLLKTPWFTLVAVLTLALGIGANTAIFSIINGIFLRPLPYPDSHRLVRLSSTDQSRNLERAGFSLRRYEMVRDQQQVFRDLALGIFTGFTVTGRGDPEQVQGIHVTANYLSTLGVQPLHGRSFSADEDRKGGAPVVMLSHRYWERHYQGSRAVLGEPITIDGVPHTIIGVLPPSLSNFPLNQTDLWAPRPTEVAFLHPSQLEGGGFFFQVIARLKEGVSLAQARENINVIAGAYLAQYPANSDARTQAEVVPLLDDLVGNQRPTYALLFGAVGCVLLIACANVANLLLVRFSSRRREIAIRFALGADRRHVVQQLLVESTLVALAGGALGLLGARWGLDVFVSLGAEFIPRSLEIGLDPRALLFTGGLALVTGLAMGIFPALSAARGNANESLKDSSRGSTGSGAQRRVRSGLLVLEIALSFVLLVGASLLLVSFARVQRVSPGFQADNVFVGFLNLPPTKYADAQSLSLFYRRLTERLEAIPGARSVAIHDTPPLSGNAGPAPIAVVGRPLLPLGDRPNALRHLVGPNSFATLGIPILKGRDFNARDLPDSPQTVIINESFAKAHFPGEDPIGRQIMTGMAQRVAEVVGVVADTHTANLTTPPQPEYFLPALQRGENFTTVLVRTQGDPAAFTASVRAALREVDPDQALLNPQPLTELIADNLADRKLIMVLLSTFAGLALLLACVGVYSVMAYVVGQRTAEIGIRMALGASPGDVQSMVIGQGLKLTGLGIVIGLVAAFALTRLMQQLLFGVTAHDPLIYAAIAALLALVALCACWLPARRATKVDPLIALRAE